MTIDAQSGNHLDANLLSAFAEGGLSAKERTACLEHLAGCGRCREIAFLVGAEVSAEDPAPERGRRFSWNWWPVSFAMAGVVVAIVIGLIVHGRTRSEAGRPAEVALAPAPPQVPVPEPSAASTPSASAAASAPVAPPALVPVTPKAIRPPAAAPPVASAAVLDKESVTDLPINGRSMANAPLAQGAAGLASQHSGYQGPVQNATALPPLSPRVEQQAQAVPSQTAQDSARFAVETQAAPLALKRFTSNFAQISGVVTDGSGASISQALVMVDAASGNLHRQTSADGAGRFAIAGLQPGKYRVQISAPGFAAEVRDVELGADQVAQVDSRLTVGSVSETVAVASGAAMDVQTATVPMNLQTSVRRGERMLALDASGKLLLRKKSGGRWKKAGGPWKKAKISELLLTADGDFKVTTDYGAWVSSDGEHWTVAQ